jgi:hypothetical protein
VLFWSILYALRLAYFIVNGKVRKNWKVYYYYYYYYYYLLQLSCHSVAEEKLVVKREGKNRMRDMSLDVSIILK